MKKAQVMVQRVEDIDSSASKRQALRHILETLAPAVSIPPDSTVLVKVNICLVKGPETGSTLDPYLARCLAEWLLEERRVRKVQIAESDATHLNADLAFKVLGWEEMFADLPGVCLFNLSRDEQVEVDLHGRLWDRRAFARTHLEAVVFISFAKLKTHLDWGMTCIWKNQFGCLPEKIKIVYHPHLDQALHDVNKVRFPDLCLVDGLIGMEGSGPADGIPKLAKVLVGGTDPIATDLACARLMKIPLRQISPLRYAIKAGLGTTQYEELGTPIRECAMPFRRYPWWRQGLRRSLKLVQQFR
jgi:uncharacterized protein (DUF362 family)